MGTFPVFGAFGLASEWAGVHQAGLDIDPTIKAKKREVSRDGGCRSGITRFGLAIIRALPALASDRLSIYWTLSRY